MIIIMIIIITLYLTTLFLSIGGGQIKAISASSIKESISEGKQRVLRVDELYHTQRGVRVVEDSPLIQYIYGTSISLNGLESVGEKKGQNYDPLSGMEALYQEWFHTRYSI